MQERPMLRLQKRTVYLKPEVEEALSSSEIVFAVVSSADSYVDIVKVVAEKEVAAKVVLMSSCSLDDVQKFQDWVDSKEAYTGVVLQACGLQAPEWYTDFKTLPNLAFVASGDKALWDKTAVLLRKAGIKGTKTYVDARLTSAPVMAMIAAQDLVAQAQAFMQGVAMAEAAGIPIGPVQTVMAQMASSSGTFAKEWPQTESFGTTESWSGLLTKVKAATAILKVKNDLATDQLRVLDSVDKAAHLSALAAVDEVVFAPPEPPVEAPAEPEAEPEKDEQAPAAAETAPAAAEDAAAAAEEATTGDAPAAAETKLPGRRLLAGVGGVVGSFRKRLSGGGKNGTAKEAAEEAVVEESKEEGKEEGAAEEAPEAAPGPNPEAAPVADPKEPEMPKPEGTAV